MKFSKRTSKFLTLITALLLSSLVIWVFASYIADRQIKISYEITPSVTGHYRLSAFFTDGKNQEVNRGDGNKALGYEKDLTAGTPTVIEFKKPAGNTQMIEKTELLFEYLTEPRNDVSVEISDIVINHHGVDNLYVKSQDPERTLAEKCRADDCKGQETDSYNLNLTQNHTAVYLHEDLAFETYYTHFSIWPTLIIIVVSTGLFYKLIRTILNIRRHQETRVADVVFIIAVLITMFIPVLGLRTDHKVQEPNENRMLAEYKPLLTGDLNHPVNLNWMKDFETWFNDRFGGRNKIIGIEKKAHLKLDRLIGVPNVGICQKSNGWCFTSSELRYLNGTFKGPLTNLEYIQEIANGTDIPIYILLFPLKTEIYPEKALFVKNLPKNAQGFNFLVKEQLSSITNNNVSIIDLRTVLKRAKDLTPDNLLYYADEHHATEYGDYIVLEYLFSKFFNESLGDLLEHISSKYPNRKFNISNGDFFEPSNDYWEHGKKVYGQTYGSVFGDDNRKHKNKYFRLHSYPFFSLTNEYTKDVKVIYDECDSYLELVNQSNNAFKVYILGNSFVDSLAKVVAMFASDTYRRRFNTECNIKNKVLTTDKVVEQINSLKPNIILMPLYSETFLGIF